MECRAGSCSMDHPDISRTPVYDIPDGLVQNPRTDLSYHPGSGHDFRAIQTARIPLLFTI